MKVWAKTSGLTISDSPASVILMSRRTFFPPGPVRRDATRTFSGLRFRWTMPALWSAETASRTALAIWQASWRVKLRCSLW